MYGIIVEGPNSAGKSTLCAALSRQMGRRTTHSGTQPDDLDEACQTQLNQLLDGVIVDRITPISELVYHPESAELFNHKDWLRWMTNSSMVIYCTADGIPTNKEYYPEGHYDELIKDRSTIRQRYDDIMSTILHIKYDYHTDSINKLLGVLREKI
jgi:hypothetical protein